MSLLSRGIFAGKTLLVIGLLNNKSIVCKQMSFIFSQAKVIRTRSTESMPFPFSFMMVVVSFLWLCYGTVVNDRNIQVTRHSLTPHTQGSQLGRNIYGWNTQMYVVRSLQGERKIHLLPDIVLCWPLLHFASSDAILNFERIRKLSVCQPARMSAAKRFPKLT